jgi:hypothetical protein
MIKYSLSNYRENEEIEVYTLTTTVSVFGIIIFKRKRAVFKAKNVRYWRYADNGEYVYECSVNELVSVFKNPELFENKTGDVL